MSAIEVHAAYDGKNDCVVLEIADDSGRHASGPVMRSRVLTVDESFALIQSIASAAMQVKDR